MDTFQIECLVIAGVVVVGFGYIWLQLRAAQRDTQALLDRMADWRRQDELARAENTRFAKKFGQI